MGLQIPAAGFTATHVIDTDAGRICVQGVAADDGSRLLYLYTEIEWTAKSWPDWRRHPDNGLTFRGCIYDGAMLFRIEPHEAAVADVQKTLRFLGDVFAATDPRRR
jgi:hypothetical protein